MSAAEFIPLCDCESSTVSVLRKLSRSGLKLVRFPRFSKSKKEEVRIMTCARRGSSVVVTDRRRRQCRGPSRGARLRRRRASAGWIEIFPAARLPRRSLHSSFGCHFDGLSFHGKLGLDLLNTGQARL